MDEARRYGLNPHLDIHQILSEAKSRWLRPNEICEILRNYLRFNITPDPPYKPPGGSLFLFDRKALRYFRKDGHHWRKKKDGKTVREAHEKLKSGSVDVLHCYYAHGEDNENFQRRSYWLLDGKLEHIVLVHYRDLNEGCSSIATQQLNSNLILPGVPTSLEICSTQLNSSAFVNHSTYASSTSNVEWNAQTSSEFEDGDSCNDFCGASRSNTISGSGFQVSSFSGNDLADDDVTVHTGSTSQPYGGFVMNSEGLNRLVETFPANQIISHNLMLSRGQSVQRASDAAVSFGGGQFNHNNTPCTWSEVLRLNQNHNEIKKQSIFFEQLSSSDALKNKFTDPIPDNCVTVKFEIDNNYQDHPEPYSQPYIGAGSTQVQIKVENTTLSDLSIDDDSTLKDDSHLYEISHHNHSYLAPPSDINKLLECKTEVTGALKGTMHSRDIHDGVLGEFRKLDSFGRWMNKELVKDCDESLISSECNYWNTVAIQSDEKELSSLSGHMQLDIVSLAPSLSQEQLFSIIDFSPDWTYSGVGTKIIITGTFLGEVQPGNIKWCCMFGEFEVSAELLTTNTIRCHAPPHCPGRVPFYITCSNRLACSEVREFEYRGNPPNVKFSSSLKNGLEDELHLQICFAKSLSLGSVKMKCSVENCYKCSLKKKLFHMLIDETEWDEIEKFKAYDKHYRNHRDVLLVKLLKGRLCEWLVYTAHEEGKGPNALDKQGRGIIHLAAALGYEWAMRPIVAAGVSPSFRDVHGRTALHWAAYYGREETVAVLLKLGASPGAVEDPTSKFPQGQTAADLASNRGHKGIAGYLAEADLTSHLITMSLTDKTMDSISSDLATENSAENLEEQKLASVDEEQISLRESLAAVRNSTQAAARIQAVFRVQSFRQRELKEYAEKSEIAQALMFSSLNNNIHRMSNFNSTSHTAAIKIQQKYRGWKGRREFLKIRDRIVKIQAHVRGHQVRKQYKKVVWSVSIVEKVILRWRRKGSGLRGFRAEKMNIGPEQVEAKTDDYEFLRLGRKQKVAGIEKALARVKSMVRYPEAREQYLRLVTCSNKSNLMLGVEDGPLDRNLKEENNVEKDPLATMND